MMGAPTRESKPRLLVIDDEPRVGGMLERLLQRRYDVTTTTSGREGLRLATNEDWDAILCDVMMPELSGPALFMQLGAARRELLAHFGFMTGGTFDSSTEEFLQKNAEGGWLSKPFRLAEVEAFIEALRSRSKLDTDPEAGK